MGPITSRVVLSYVKRTLPSRAKGGLRPTTPQSAAGILTEPPVSLPIAPAQSAADVAAPDPPLEPPGIFVKS